MMHPMLTLGRVFRASFQSISRNWWFAIASTTIMTLTLLTVTVFFILNVLINKAADTAKEKVGLATVNLKEWVSEKETLALRETIKSVSGVTEVNFVSKEEALDRFKELHKDDPLLLEAVSEENPLLNSFEVRVAEPEDFNGVKETLAQRENARYVEDFSFDGDREATISRISNVSNFIKKLGLFLSLMFVGVASVIVFNTIRIGIFSRKQEVEIMHLNGATSSYIRAPFLIEGSLYGFFAILLTAVVFALTMNSVGTTFYRYFGEIGDIKGFVLSNLHIFSGMLALTGIGSGFFASWLAVSKHLKVS